MMSIIKCLAAASLAVIALVVCPLINPTMLQAQEKRGSDPPHTLDLTWDRWLDHDEIGERMQLMARTWPDFLSLSSMGDSYGGRELWVMTINNPDTGPELGKAAMYI